MRALYPRATRVIAVSEGVAQDLRDNFGVRGERVTAVANPVDVEAIRARSRQGTAVAIDGSYILAAGRLVKEENKLGGVSEYKYDLAGKLIEEKFIPAAGDTLPELKVKALGAGGAIPY